MQQSKEFKFNGAFVKNEDKITEKKSIVICGITRGGTSFAASVFGRLGVPFSRKSERPIGRRYEHRDLRDAFFNGDAAAVRGIATTFSEQYPVWAWKLPAIQTSPELAAANVVNPHFVIILKEPLSVAARKTDINGKETLKGLKQVLKVYQHLTQIALTASFPVFLISYDRAMAKLPAFLPEAAKFAGVTSFDMDATIAGIHEDGKRYFRSPGPGGQDASDAAEGTEAVEQTARAEPAPKPAKTVAFL